MGLCLKSGQALRAGRSCAHAIAGVGDQGMAHFAKWIADIPIFINECEFDGPRPWLSAVVLWPAATHSRKGRCAVGGHV
jgi:hypothetical protein